VTTAPKVTVALPVHNGAAHLEDAIESILEQDLAELELVIADNGSDDATERICRRALRDARVRYERSDTNRGAAWNYNRLVAMARAPYFKWAAHDDLLRPAFLRRCVEELDASPAAVLAYPRSVLIDGDGLIVDPHFHDGLDLRDAAPRERFRRYLVHPGEQHPVFGVVRTDALRRTGLIANCWGGDQVLLAELLFMGEWHEVPERLFLRRYHSGTSLAANRTPEEVARWFDTSARARSPLPRTRLTAELVGVASRAELPARQRAGCVLDVATRWTPRYARVMAGEVRRTARVHLDRHRPPRAAHPVNQEVRP
jgi:glycosyltransferase involved in cell wall biosynthesis